jgi:hypothetical protein
MHRFSTWDTLLPSLSPSLPAAPSAAPSLPPLRPLQDMDHWLVILTYASLALLALALALKLLQQLAAMEALAYAMGQQSWLRPLHQAAAHMRVGCCGRRGVTLGGWRAPACLLSILHRL